MSIERERTTRLLLQKNHLAHLGKVESLVLTLENEF